MNDIHNHLNAIHLFLLKTFNMVFVVGLKALKLLSLVEQVNQLTSIDFKKPNGKVKLRIVHQFLNDLIRSQDVLTRHSAIRSTHHGEGLARPSLTIGKACGIGPVKETVDQGLHTLLEDHLVVV